MVQDVTRHRYVSQRPIWLETTEVENLHLYRLSLNQLRGYWLRPLVTRRGGRLTSACLMAVRKSVQGFLGNRCYMLGMGGE